MKKSVLALVLVFFTVVCSGNLIAKERHGADLVITKTDGQQINGELIAVKETSLLLLDSQTGADVSVEIGEIRVIRIVKKSKALLGIGIGLLAGLVGGLIIGGTEKTIEGTRGEAVAIYTGAIGGPAALIGGIIGAAIGTDKTIQIEGKSPEETKGILEKLRRQARVTNAQ
jgi:hypothetical protein